MACWFCINTLHDWLKNPRHFFIQSEVKPKPVVARSQAFSLGSRRFRVLIGSLDFVSLVTGYSDYAGLDFSILELATLDTLD